LQERKLPLRDITNRDSANAFLFGVIFNQAQRAEKSWEAPYILAERLGTIDPFKIAEIPLPVMADVISSPPSIHRYARTMGKFLIGACQVLVEQYDGDARNIWLKAKSSQDLIDKFITLPGIGTHKAYMAIFILIVEYQVVGTDKEVIDKIRNACPSLYRLYL